jgi:hypothetical protein
MIKKAGKIVLWTVLSVLGLIVLALVILNMTPVQNFIAQKVTQELSEKLGTQVRIGEVNLRMFNSLAINDFYLEDLKGDTLINAEELRGKISLLKLFKKKIYIKSLVLENATVYISVDNEGKSNLEFLQKLFEKKKPKDAKEWAFYYQITDIKLNSIDFAFNDYRKPQNSNGKAINFANIRINNINSILSVDKIAKNYYEGKVKSLNFSEKSGFALKDFQTKFLFNDSICKIEATKLSLSKSKITIDYASVRYDSIERLKSNFEKTEIVLGMLNATINPKDLSMISNKLAGLNQILTAKLYASGTIEDLEISKLNVNYGSQIGFSGRCRATGLPDIRSTYFSANIDDLHGTMTSVQDLIANIKKQPVKMPEELKNINRFNYTGKISGYAGNLALLGKLHTGIGNIETNLAIRSDNEFESAVLEGHISTSNLNLAAITSPESGFGNIILDADAIIKVGKNIPFQSEVNTQIKEFTYKNHIYSNILVNGNIHKNKFEGNAAIDDKNGKANFHGLVDLSQKDKKFHFTADVNDLSLNKLSLIEKYPNLKLAFHLDADFAGDKIETINGTINLDDITISNNGTYHINKFNISSHTRGDSLVTYVESNIINGYVSGKYSFAKLPTDILNMVQNAVPILQKDNLPKKDVQRNNLGFYLEIEPLQPLCDVMEIDWRTTKKSTFGGFYNGDLQRFNFDLELPQITNGKMVFSNANLNCYNNEKNIKLVASTLMELRNDTLTLALNSEFENDSAILFVAWNNTAADNVIAGEILTNSKIYKENNDLQLNVNILPTQIVLKNNVLDIDKSNIFTDFKMLSINNLLITGENQKIKLNGKMSKSEDEHLIVDLERIDLDFITSLLRKDAAVSFGGMATGRADISMAFGQPILVANVTSPNFIFNEAKMGRLYAQSSFNHNTNSLDFNGIVLPDDTPKDTSVIISGGFYFGQDSLVIKGDAKKLNLQFVKKFTQNVFEELNGYGTGKVLIYGNLKKKGIIVETVAKVDEGRLKIGFLGSDFFFNDTIIMKRDSILLKNIGLTDIEGNKGNIDGYISYEYFDNLKFNLKLIADKMLVLNTKESSGSSFYGKTYVTGTGNISGNEQIVNINCNLTSEPNTKIYLVMDKASSATSSDFIQFVDNDTINIAEKEKIKPQDDDNNTNINVELFITANPNAELQLFLDRRSGDMITAKGEGNLRLAYNKNADMFQLFGNYSLIEGRYLFTFQQALPKNFIISDGASLVWNGSPENPTINIKAYHQTNASIAGLFDDAIINRPYSKNVPVNCILNLTGNLTHPNIAFDLDLPNSDDEVRQALKNIVNTDDLMNREIIYLLAFNRFYNPNQERATEFATRQDVLNLATSTVGGLLNSRLSQISNKWNFGINMQLGDETTQTKNEYGVTINYTPNDKIVINSSLGYRDYESAAENSDVLNNAILDFDIEYKLNQSGRLSAKAYNHTNRITDLTSNPYTQGIGIIYRENFNSLRELVYKWKQNRANRKAARIEHKKQKEAKKNK